MMMKTRGGMMGNMMLMKLVMLVVVVVGGMLLYRMWIATPALPSDLKDGGVKAVFIDNGQVYFGYVEAANKDFLRIKNPYYLQRQTVLQEPVEEGKEATTRQQLSLTALGGDNLQLHAPEREMYVPWDTILYMEDLKEDSEVVKLITEDVAKVESGDSASSGGTNANTNSSASASTNTNSEAPKE